MRLIRAPQGVPDDKIRAKATEELGLVRQFAGTVESQLDIDDE